MKRKFIFVLSAFALFVFSNRGYAQAPQLFNYQGVARAGATIISNQLVGLQFTVRDQDSSGTIIYQETQTTTTNAYGLFAVTIGSGVPSVGTFASIDWGTNLKYLRVGIDTSGGNTFLPLSPTQLVSVPYALYAQNARNGNWNTIGNNIYNANLGYVGIGTDTPGQTLSVNGSLGVLNSNETQFYTDNGLTLKGFVGLYNQDYDFSIAATTENNWLRIGANEASIAFFPDNTLTTGSIPKVIIDSTGNVGIGTTTPAFPLEVDGSVSQVVTDYGYLNNGSSNTYGYYNGTTSHNTSIYASADIVAGGEFEAVSDRRIKNIIGHSNNEQDLNTLMQVKITDYKYIDTIEKGNGIHKKVIAQELEQVYPIAVNTMTNVIPDIYHLAEIKNGVVTLANSLKVGEKVRLIFANRKELVDVLEADANSFKVNLKDEGPVFVYGRQVNDFHTVDYDALTTLNISATQQLVKMINDLKSENAGIKQVNKQLFDKNAELDKALGSLQNDMDAIKQFLNIKSEAGK